MNNASANSNGRKKFQLFILILLVISLPLAVYVALRQTYFKGKAASTSSLSLVPQISPQPTPPAIWKFPLAQTVAVKFIVTAGTSPVEGIQGVIKYDPTVLSVSSESKITYTTAIFLKQDVLKCTNIHILRDAGGLETGIIHISRTSISPLPICDITGRTDAMPAENTPPANVPLPAGQSETLATINFQTLKTTTNNSTITLDYNSDPKLSGSHISAYQGAGVENLGLVTNVTFSVSPSGQDITLPPTATATLIPSATTIPPSPTPSCPRKSQGDANCDGKIDYFDFNRWRSEYLITSPTPTPSVYQADFDRNGIVNYFDFNRWRNTYVEEHTTPTP